MLAATAAGDLSLVCSLVTAGASPHQPDVDGTTPLVLAAGCGHLNIIKYLVNFGVDINSIDGAMGDGPLHKAAFNGQADAVKLLIELGADVNALNFKGTPLMYAVLKANYKCVQVLLKSAALVDRHVENGVTPLYVVSAGGPLGLIEMLITHGGDVNFRRKCGRTPVYAATLGSAPSHVRCLLQAGANPDIEVREQDVKTPLMVAIYHENINIVKLLLEHNCDPDKGGYMSFSTPEYNQGYISPLIVALNHGSDTVKHLYQAGCNLAPLWKPNQRTIFFLTLRRFSSQELISDIINRWQQCFQSWMTVPRSLKEQCKFRIRRQMGWRNFTTNVQTLNLPTLMKQYLVNIFYEDNSM